MSLEPKHQVFRVEYDAATSCWVVKQRGRTRPLTQSHSKMVAIDLALKLARSAQTAQLFIHRRDGSIETEHTFGEDMHGVA